MQQIKTFPLLPFVNHGLRALHNMGETMGSLGKSKILVGVLSLTVLACGKTVETRQGFNNSGASAGIIGGQNVQADDALAMSTVALYDVSKGSLCTATILSDSLLLTAAHCVVDSKPSDLLVMFGTELEAAQSVRKVKKYLVSQAYRTYLQNLDLLEKDPELLKAVAELSALIDADPSIQAEVAKLEALAASEPDLSMEDPRVVAILSEIERLKAANPEILAKTNEVLVVLQGLRLRAEKMKDIGDVAVVKFEGGLPEGYKAGKLMRNKADLVDGMDVTLAGYGISNGVSKEGAGTLRKTNLKLTDSKYANAEVRFDQSGGTGACHGDSGGPALATVRGEVLVLGVTSRGSEDKADDCSKYAIYASVPGEIAFIDAAMAELNKPTLDPIGFFGSVVKNINPQQIPGLFPGR
jgi:hypothetical protein